MRYDTLIIGAGLSGLAAGIRLAYFEKPVCILERHTTIGGLNSFYRLHRRDYDVGLHAVTNYVPPGTKTGPLSKILRQLRLRWEDFDLRPQCGSQVAFPDHRLHFKNDFPFFVEQIAQQFPKEIDGFRRLVRAIDEFDLTTDAPPSLSTRKVLAEYLHDPLLCDMLLCPIMFYGSATPDDLEFIQFVIMFRSIFQEGFGRPHEGVRLILRQLIRKYKSLGGELRLRAGVRSIIADGGRVTGVILDDGTVLEADNVVSSAGYVETMHLCDHQPDAQPCAEGDLRPGELTFFETISSLNCQPADLGHNSTIVFYNDSPQFTYANPQEPCDLRSGIICSPNNFEYDEPLAEGSIRITAIANKDYWMTLSDAEYAAEKQRWYEQTTASAIRYIPDFRPAVVQTDSFTPRTIKKFTGHVNGCVYGAPKKHWSGQTHLNNLFVCGTDQGYLGIIGTMLSGIMVANRHVLRQG